ncbi:MAG: 4Fe-4S dicluster domain-containing protein [Candidatus Magnetoovum sp. WYHC-5]|nr:4Fe-4S dicluster domain-containing protein [Candidatus Magnetoovum sp. WYHC-5]
MHDLINVRINQGFQSIKDIKKALPFPRHRGLPVVSEEPCKSECSACVDSCPTGAITLEPVSIDMKKCLFCPECELACPSKKIHFTNNVQISATNPETLIISAKNNKPIIEVDKKIRRIFWRSLKLRSVSAGGCNGCELELNALSNVNFDIGRFGIDFVASPRHADGVVLTGPVSENMAYAFEETIRAIPEPKILILAGACALSGGLFVDSPAINRHLLSTMKVDLYIPGCPVHPLTVANALLAYLGR